MLLNVCWTLNQGRCFFRPYESPHRGQGGADLLVPADYVLMLEL